MKKITKFFSALLALLAVGLITVSLVACSSGDDSDSGSGNGAVVLCHETYDTTAAAIEKIAPYAKQKGWQIAAIGDMYKAKGKSIPGGQEIKKVY